MAKRNGLLISSSVSGAVFVEAGGAHGSAGRLFTHQFDEAEAGDFGVA